MPSNTAENDELQLEVISESDGVEDTQTTDGEGESEDTKLNLETEEQKVDKLTPAQEQAQRQENTWLNNVIAGKKTVEEAPQWLQARLNARLEATNKAPDTEELVKKILEKEREDGLFKELQSQIPKLTAAQAQELQERFNSLKVAGRVIALKSALDAMGLSQKLKEAEQRGVAKGRMSLPRSGQPSVRKSEQLVGGVPLSVIQDNKAWHEMLRNGG